MRRLVLVSLASLGLLDASGGPLVRPAGAAQPCTGPLASQPVWTADGAQSGSGFASVVSTAGDVNGDGFSDVLVATPSFDGVYADAGRVALYLGSGAGLGSVPSWTAEGDRDSASFGAALAAAGDVNGDGYADVLIGAPKAGADGVRDGRAYLYYGSAAGLAPTPAWTASGGTALAAFGAALGRAGDANADGFADVVVGAPGYTNGQAGEGRALLFLGSPAGLAAAPAWTVESDQAGAALGSAVASAGDVNADGFADVVVGAPAYDNGQADEGRARVYLGSANGLALTAVWTAEGDVVNGGFGAVVGTAGDVNGDGYAELLIGAPSFSNGQTGEGRCTLYAGSSAGPAQAPAWLVESHQVGAAMGTSLGTAGDVNGDGYADVVVGTSLADVTLTDEGRVSVYLGSAVGLAASPAWTFVGGQAGAQLGRASAAAGDVNGDGFGDILAGAPHYGAGVADAGRALLFPGCGRTLDSGPNWTKLGDQEGENFGFRAASAGDVNGDGYDDVVVAAQLYDGAGHGDEGRAWVYLGSPTGLADSAAWFAESGEDSAKFGTSASGAGDVNGDGYGDVLIGCPDCEVDNRHEGRLFLYLGSPAGLATTPVWTVNGQDTYAEIGVTSAGVGDVNGDGYADLATGSRFYSNGGYQYGGLAAVFYGSPTGPAGANWIGIGKQNNAQYGVKVAGAGDVNGDGYSDLLVGAWHWKVGTNHDAGAAFLYLGGPAGLDTTAAWFTTGDEPGAQYGLQAGTAGDVNGDGYSDVLIGANAYSYPFPYGGRAYLYLGSPTGLSTTPAWTLDADRQHSFLGTVSTAGDVNGDGYSDVLISAPMFDDGQTDEGIGYLFLGSPTGLSTQRVWSFESDKEVARFGEATATAGDVNGDGFADVIFGADGLDTPLLDAGGAFLWYGNAGRGLTRTPRQARASGAGPIQPLGLTDAGTAFRLRATGRTAAGRGRVRLEWEVSPVGGAGVSATGRTEYRDTGAPQPVAGSTVAFDELASGLTPLQAYRWRMRVASDDPLFPRSPWLTLQDFFPGAADVRTSGATAIRGAPGRPADFAVTDVEPDPVRHAARIAYTLPDGGPWDVRLTVYDVAGRRVATVVEAREAGGVHTASWSTSAGGRPLATGVYILHLSAGTRAASRRIAVTR